MILLDTNIISEPMRPTPQPQVAHWLMTQLLDHLWISAVTATELLYGINRLPTGQRQQVLMNKGFKERLKVFDYDCAVMAAQIRAERDRIGQPISMADAQIAAIARVHHFALATRNIKDFAHCGLVLINPFAA